MLQKYKKFDFPNYEYNRINSAYLPRKAYISLCQDGKITCKSCVNVGDNIKEGEVVAFDSESRINIHSSVTGIVEDFQECTMPNGTKSTCIVIMLKGSFVHTGKLKELQKWKYDTSNKIITNLKQRGVINTFNDKNCCLADQLESYICNDSTLGVILFDIDKSLSISKTALKFYQDLIFEGSLIIAHAIKAKSIVFFSDRHESHYLNQINITEMLAETSYSFIHINNDKYPSASPFKLKTSIQKSKLLDDKSFYKRIDIDTTTALAAYHAIALGLPITETLVEINGNSLHENGVYIAKIGLPIKKLIEECGGTQKSPGKIVINGLLKGKAIKNIDTPVTKYLKSITLQAAKDLQNETPSHCINCARCRSVCPIGLQPDVFYAHKNNDIDISINKLLSAKLCDECGLCNTSCPARLPLFQTISKLKEDSDERKI